VDALYLGSPDITRKYSRKCITGPVSGSRPNRLNRGRKTRGKEILRGRIQTFCREAKGEEAEEEAQLETAQETRWRERKTHNFRISTTDRISATTCSKRCARQGN
jgi:hypothetical protein